MSDLSSKRQSAVTEPAGAVAALGAEGQRPSSAIKIWATFGGAVLLLQLWVWGKWVTGPYFQQVYAGPTPLPLYMKIPLIANAVVLWVGLPFAIYYFFIRPWRRERRITLDGMLFLSMGLMFFQDPLLNYFNTWCTYNTWLFNKGAWTPHLPGWFSPDEPGRMVPEPLLTNSVGYAYGVLLITIVGCFVMRKIKSRWPNISNVRLILATYAFAFVLDFVMEALILLPTGLYTYPGAIRAVSFNAGTYYQWPVYEGLLWGGVQTALCCLRFFTDDRGRTIVERGLDRIRGGFARQQFVRFLAIFAAVSACFFFLYNVPVQWFAMHSDPWPEDHLKRSYFNGGVCGDGSEFPCPDPSLPLPSRWSGYIDKDGQLVLPEGKQLPQTVPFDRGK